MIRKFLDCSITHVSKSSRAWLNEIGLANANTFDPNGLAVHHVAAHTYGWWIFVPLQGDEYPVGFPDDLKPVCAHARHHDCDYIQFDADASVISELPIFETWEGELQ